MSRAIAALASRYVGRRAVLTTGQTVTIHRVTGRGFTVTLTGITARDIARWID